MIEIEGYKAFHGTMRITPKCSVPPFELTGNWLYKPEYKCWYGCGRSFGADICEVVRESTDDGKIEVVTCEGCKNWDQNLENGLTVKRCSVLKRFTIHNEYCCWGERKDG